MSFSFSRYRKIDGQEIKGATPLWANVFFFKQLFPVLHELLPKSQQYLSDIHKNKRFTRVGTISCKDKIDRRGLLIASQECAIQGRFVDLPNQHFRRESLSAVSSADPRQASFARELNRYSSSKKSASRFFLSPIQHSRPLKIERESEPHIVSNFTPLLSILLHYLSARIIVVYVTTNACKFLVWNLKWHALIFD